MILSDILKDFWLGVKFKASNKIVKIKYWCAKKMFSSKMSYNSAWGSIKACMERDKTTEEKIAFLDYVIDSVINELCANALAIPIYCGSDQITSRRMPIPFGYIENENMVDVNLGQSKVYVNPWKLERTMPAIFKISKEPFEHNKDHHTSWYYDDIGLCCVGNGNHSINAGRYLKKGTIKSQFCKMEDLYETLSTDGETWFRGDGHDDEKVWDFRFALVFTVAKERHNLRAQT